MHPHRAGGRLLLLRPLAGRPWRLRTRAVAFDTAHDSRTHRLTPSPPHPHTDHTDRHLHQPTPLSKAAAAAMVCEDKRRIIAYLWYLNALLSIAYVIVAICAAANQKDVSGRAVLGRWGVDCGVSMGRIDRITRGCLAWPGLAWVALCKEQTGRDPPAHRASEPPTTHPQQPPTKTLPPHSWRLPRRTTRRASRPSGP